MKTTEKIDPSEIKTHLNDIELEYFKNLLLNKRREAEGELETLRENVKNLTELDDEDHSSVAHHFGDYGSDTEEEELNYQLIERTRAYIEQIDDALERIENKTYGICQATGEPIVKGRLEAVPHTRFSIDAKKSGLAEDA